MFLDMALPVRDASMRSRVRTRDGATQWLYAPANRVAACSCKSSGCMLLQIGSQENSEFPNIRSHSIADNSEFPNLRSRSVTEELGVLETTIASCSGELGVPKHAIEA
jgi:hypothetical protein